MWLLSEADIIVIFNDNCHIVKFMLRATGRDRGKIHGGGGQYQNMGEGHCPHALAGYGSDAKQIKNFGHI